MDTHEDAVAPVPPTEESAVDATTRAEAVAEARRLVLEEHLSANEASARAAAALGVSGRSVARWAARQGQALGALSRDSAKTRAATETWRAQGGYTAVRRLTLCDRLLEAIEAQVEYAAAGELRELAMAFAVASDKRDKLEDRAGEQAALADPAFWAWLDERHGGDPVQSLLRPSVPFTSAPEAVTPARFHLVAPALRLPAAPPADSGPPRTPPRGRRKRPTGEAAVADDLRLLRDAAAPVSKRMAVAKALAERAWGPAPAGDPADPRAEAPE